MKRVLTIAALLIFTGSVNAGWFSAGWKPSPNLTLFGQKINWPLPSLCIGKAAGVLADAGVSADGVYVKIHYLSIDVPFPSLTLSAGKDKPKVELKLGEVNTTEHKPKEK